jgi:hypothetical protein
VNASNVVLDVNSKIARLTDLSGNGNHWDSALLTAPALVASAISGKPAASFNSSAGLTCVSVGTALLTGSAGHRFVILRNDLFDRFVDNSWGSDGQQSYYEFSGTIYNDFGTSSRKSYANAGHIVQGTPFLLETSASTVWTDYINGTQRHTEANTFGMNSAAPAVGFDATCLFAEQLVYDHVLSGADRRTVLQYLAARYPTISIAVP